MLKNRPQSLSDLEFVCIDDLVPEDHLLRKIEAKVDLILYTTSSKRITVITMAALLRSHADV